MISASCYEKEFSEFEVVACCFGIKSQMCAYKVLCDLAPTDLSSLGPWMCFLSVCLHILFHPPRQFSPLTYSSTFPLLTSGESSEVFRHVTLHCWLISSPHFCLCNISHTSHYLFSVCFRKCSALWGQGLWFCSSLECFLLLTPGP